MIKLNEVYNGDCLELMKLIDPKSINMILCDLPYGCTARNKWDIIIPFEPLWKEYERIIKDNGAIVLTATEPFSSMLINSNMKLFRYDLIWEKHMATGFFNANRMPLRNHEQILVFYKTLPIYNPQMKHGKPYKLPRRGDDTKTYNLREQDLKYTTLNNGSRFPKSVLKFKHDFEKIHPTQKPVALFEYLIKTYTNENDVILDNCAGSGTTGIACKKNNRNYILMEKDEEYYNKILERLNKFTNKFNNGTLEEIIDFGK